MREELLEEIKKLAELQYTDFQIGEMLGLSDADKNELYEEGTEARKFYKTGMLTMEASVRKSIFTLANAGSSPAQQMAMKIIEERKMNER